MDAVVVRVGIDIGQKVDPTAIAVVEWQPRPDGDHWVCRFLERQPLGTPYPAVAQRLRDILAGIADTLPWVEVGPQRRMVRPDLDLDAYCDATGVGQPVVDVLNDAGLEVIPVYFTHGDRRSVADGQVLLGKAWLVSRLKTLFQQGLIHLPPRHPEAQAMARELDDYQIRVSDDANDRYGAFTVGSHDDLVTALGLAVQVAPSHRGATWAEIVAAFQDLPR